MRSVTITVQGGSLGSELPGHAQLTPGGPFRFVGLADDQFRGACLGVVPLGYRYRLSDLPAQMGSTIYVLTRFDAGPVWGGGGGRGL